MKKHSYISFQATERGSVYNAACGIIFTQHARAAGISSDVDCRTCLKLLEKPTSWNVEAADSSGWGANALYFATKPEAEAYARDLYSRWTACKETRAVPSRRAPNYRWDVSEGLVGLDHLKSVKENANA